MRLLLAQVRSETPGDNGCTGAQAAGPGGGGTAGRKPGQESPLSASELGRQDFQKFSKNEYAEKDYA